MRKLVLNLDDKSVDVASMRGKRATEIRKSRVREGLKGIALR